MSAFELNPQNQKNPNTPLDKGTGDAALPAAEGSGGCRPKDECLIASKVYDSCRQQDCLGRRELGPARAAEPKAADGISCKEGDIVVPPVNAASVSMEKLRVKKVIIVSKQPNSFKNGFWDIELKYVFEYRLVFREVDGSVIGSVRANSSFNKKVTLFGSIGTDILISTDLFGRSRDMGGGYGETLSLEADPFVLTESKAVALNAEIKYRRCRDGEPDENGTSDRPSEAEVTIGLFTIVKLFRIVQLTVETKGFCMPPECEEEPPICPCEFFEKIEFPWDIFSPPDQL